jgi:hypothetical protein
MKRPVCFIEKRLPAKIVITYHIQGDGTTKMQEKSIKLNKLTLRKKAIINE